MSAKDWGEEWKFRPTSRAAYLIGKAPPDEVRMHLPWAGHSPLGEEIVDEATVAWARKLSSDPGRSFTPPDG